MTRYVCSKMFTDVNIKFPNNIIKNCCKSNNYIITEEEIKSENIFVMNNEYIRRKSTMLFENELPKNGCDTCINFKENSLFNTWNQWNIEGFDAQRDNDLLMTEKFNQFEFMLSSACDLKCVYCHPKDSSSWANELSVPVHVGNNDWKTHVLSQLYDLLEKKEFEPCENYYFFFSGGEPTYNPETITMIEKIIEIVFKKTNKININIVTNANTKEKVFDKYIDLVNRYPNVKWVFDCSLDGVGKVCEAIRYGIVWDRAIINIKRMMEHPNITVRISPTINLYSIPTMEKFLLFFIELFEKHNRIERYMFNFNMAQEIEMCPSGLPNEYKYYLDNPIKICDNYNIVFGDHLRQVQNIIGSNENLSTRKKIKTKFDYFKKMRPDTDWNSLFPHIVELIDEIDD